MPRKTATPKKNVRKTPPQLTPLTETDELAAIVSISPSLLQRTAKIVQKIDYNKLPPYKLYKKAKDIFTMVPQAETDLIEKDPESIIKKPARTNKKVTTLPTISKPVALPNLPKKSRRIPGILILVLIFIFGLAAGSLLNGKLQLPAMGPASIPVSSNKYVVFLDEVYDTVQKNYWNKISDDQLINLYVLATNKLTGQLQANKIQNKAALNKMLEEILKNYPDETKKKEFSTMLADMVLANLEPFGRSRLYSQKEEASLNNNVSNKNPELNRYQELGLQKSASQTEIKTAFEKESAKWNPTNNKSTEAKDKYAQVQNAYKVLADADNRHVYDVSGVEPTMEYKLIRPNIFYIHQTKFSPTTLDELQLITAKVDSGDTLHTLILDLRDNVGGAIDLLPYFLGPFIGPNQYAYQFLHQGEKSDFKTLIGWMPGLVRYKQVVVLINSGSQSSTEVMAATLKKYNVGVLLGSKTHGWGTVEKVFPINTQIDSKEHFSAFLVHSLTLGEDGLPIEGKGVDPVIDISNPSWENELYVYYNSRELVTAVKEVLNQK